MVKKIILSTVLSFFIFVFVYYNLNTYSVFYIQQITDRKEPVIMTLLDNMWFVYKPEIDGIRYDMDGNNMILDKNSEYLSVGNLYGDDGHNYFYNTKDNYMYFFNSNFELIYASNSTKQGLRLKSINQQDIINEMYQFVKPVIVAQPEPTINLQWLYNLFYGNELKRKFI